MGAKVLKRQCTEQEAVAICRKRRSVLIVTQAHDSLNVSIDISREPRNQVCAFSMATP